MKPEPVLHPAATRSARARRAGACLALGCASVAWFFRFQLLNGWTVHFGDRYDGLIEVAILQHWANWLAGLEPWDRPLWFHPAPDVLGYNDGQFVTGLLYAAARWAGLSMTGAAEAAHAALKLLGFFGMAALLRRGLRVRRGWALFGAALFTTADLPLAHANHGQFFALGLAPWAALFAWKFAHGLLESGVRFGEAEPGRHHIRASGSRTPRALRPGLALAVVMALWAMTSFYLAWFFALYLAAALLAAAAAAGRPGLARAGRALVAQRRVLAVVAAAGAAMLLPFLAVYLPKLGETGGHGWAYVSGGLLSSVELLNIGAGNLLWGPATALLRRAVPGLTTDHDFVFGLPPALLGMTLAAAWRFRRSGAPALAAAAAGVVLCWVAMLDLGGLSPWRLVYLIAPGARGVRVVGRFQLLLLLPITAVAAVMLDRMRARGAALALAALLLAEQVSTAAPAALPDDEDAALLAGLPAPPPHCRAFYVVTARPRPYPAPVHVYDGLFPHNVDAMILAERFGTPTVNGFSTFTPPGWDFDRADRPDYRERVRRYARRFGVTGLCELDRARGRVWVEIT